MFQTFSIFWLQLSVNVRVTCTNTDPVPANFVTRILTDPDQQHCLFRINEVFEGHNPKPDPVGYIPTPQYTVRYQIVIDRL